eukprot:scaffold6949_cov94-Isochrysis_galbana.AAC.3
MKPQSPSARGKTGLGPRPVQGCSDHLQSRSPTALIPRAGLGTLLSPRTPPAQRRRRRIQRRGRERRPSCCRSPALRLALPVAWLLAPGRVPSYTRARTPRTASERRRSRGSRVWRATEQGSCPACRGRACQPRKAAGRAQTTRATRDAARRVRATGGRPVRRVLQVRRPQRRRAAWAPYSRRCTDRLTRRGTESMPSRNSGAPQGHRVGWRQSGQPGPPQRHVAERHRFAQNARPDTRRRRLRTRCRGARGGCPACL